MSGSAKWLDINASDGCRTTWAHLRPRRNGTGTSTLIDPPLDSKQTAVYSPGHR